MGQAEDGAPADAVAQAIAAALVVQHAHGQLGGPHAPPQVAYKAALVRPRGEWEIVNIITMASPLPVTLAAGAARRVTVRIRVRRLRVHDHTLAEVAKEYARGHGVAMPIASAIAAAGVI